MTIASKLFYYRRSRLGRDSEPETESEIDNLSLYRDASLRRPRGRRGDGNGQHHHDHQQQQQRREEFDRLRSFPAHDRHFSRHVSQRNHVQERELFRLDHRGTCEFGAGSSSNSGTSSCRSSGLRRYESNDQLPGAVLQARARVLERLRSVCLTGTRQSTTASGSICEEYSYGGDSSVPESGDLEADTPGEWLESSTQLAVSTVHAQPALTFNEVSKKAPGVSWEALQRLQHKVLGDEEEGDRATASLECCICLERFCEGDVLIQLRCWHRFHLVCLEPWVQTHVDCPYCRASIVL